MHPKPHTPTRWRKVSAMSLRLHLERYCSLVLMALTLLYCNAATPIRLRDSQTGYMCRSRLAEVGQGAALLAVLHEVGCHTSVDKEQ